MFKSFKITFSILIILSFGTYFTWSLIFSLVGGDILEITFFDIGQGDSIFIETPSGKQILIDGGPDKSILEKLNQEIPFYDKSIDLVILTHPDADHLTGLISVLEYYQINQILTSGFKKDTVIYQKWKKLIQEKNIPLELAQSGQRIFLGDNIVFEILWPDQSLIKTISSANNASVVGRLIYGQSEILLTGDIESKIENKLFNDEIESDVLKIAHHGSKSSTNLNFLKKVNPELAIISVGENNRYKHPHQDILKRLKDLIVYRTDKNGDIKLFTDGQIFSTITEDN